MVDEQDFLEAVHDALEYARKEAKKVEGGDPDTMISGSVDGRKSFAKNMKKFGEEEHSGGWSVESDQGKVVLTEDNSLMVKVLEGPDIQSHSKKSRALRAFGERMEEHGINCGVSVESYAY